MLFTLVDPSTLGRLDYLSMSQQALMECLVAQFNEISLHNLRDENKHFKDIKEWTGVKCADEGDVVQIEWSDSGRHGMQGSIDFQWIPPTVQDLELQAHCFAPSLIGSLNVHVLPQSLHTLRISIYISGPTDKVVISGSFSDLPESMETFDTLGCTLHMPLCLIGIPQRLHKIHISDHEFGNIDLRCDSTALTNLTLTKGSKQGTVSFLESPPMLAHLDLKENRLVGSVSFQGLPDCLEGISLGDNSFHGTIVFEDLPSSLQFIFLQTTKFEKIIFNSALPKNLAQIYAKHCGTSGTIDFRHFSQETEKIQIGGNQLSGSVQIYHLVNISSLSAENNLLEGSMDLRNLPNKLVLLNFSANQLTGTVNFGSLPPQLYTLYLQNNNLTGSFVIDSLPQSLRTVNLSSNQFEMEALVVSVGANKLPKIDLSGNSIKEVRDARGKKILAWRVTL